MNGDVIFKQPAPVVCVKPSCSEIGFNKRLFSANAVVILIFYCHYGSLKETLQLLGEVPSLSVNVFCWHIDHSLLQGVSKKVYSWKRSANAKNVQCF